MISDARSQATRRAPTTAGAAITLFWAARVNGQRTYGKFPVLTVNGPDDTNTGRWIPTTAIDQYFATLASWFGVDHNKLGAVFPNLGRFAASNLGFV